MEINNMTINNGTVDTSIIVRVKDNYGTNVIYPVCQKSQIFALMLGKKTLSPSDLHHISALGFRIGFNNIPSNLIEPFNENNFVGFERFLIDWN